MPQPPPLQESKQKSQQAANPSPTIASKSPVEEIYSHLSSKYDVGTLDEFQRDLKNPDARKEIYGLVSQDLDVGDENQFTQDMGITTTPENVPLALRVPLQEELKGAAKETGTTLAPGVIESLSDSKAYDSAKAILGKYKAEKVKVHAEAVATLNAERASSFGKQVTGFVDDFFLYDQLTQQLPSPLGIVKTAVDGVRGALDELFTTARIVSDIRRSGKYVEQGGAPGSEGQYKEPLGTPLVAQVHGIPIGRTTSDRVKLAGEIAARQAAAYTRLGFSLMTPFSPALAAFTYGNMVLERNASKDVQKVVNTVMSPLTSIAESNFEARLKMATPDEREAMMKTGISKTTMALAELGDLVYQLLAAKGIEKVTFKAMASDAAKYEAWRKNKYNPSPQELKTFADAEKQVLLNNDKLMNDLSTAGDVFVVNENNLTFDQNGIQATITPKEVKQKKPKKRSATQEAIAGTETKSQIKYTVKMGDIEHTFNSLGEAKTFLLEVSKMGTPPEIAKDKPLTEFTLSDDTDIITKEPDNTFGAVDIKKLERLGKLEKIESAGLDLVDQDGINISDKIRKGEKLTRTQSLQFGRMIAAVNKMVPKVEGGDPVKITIDPSAQQAQPAKDLTLDFGESLFDVRVRKALKYFKYRYPNIFSLVNSISIENVEKDKSYARYDVRTHDMRINQYYSRNLDMEDLVHLIGHELTHGIQNRDPKLTAERMADYKVQLKTAIKKGMDEGLSPEDAYQKYWTDITWEQKAEQGGATAKQGFIEGGRVTGNVKNVNARVQAARELAWERRTPVPVSKNLVDSGFEMNKPVEKKDILEEAGLKFIGEQSFETKEFGKGKLFYADDPLTKSTLAFREADLTPEKVRAKIKESRDKFGIQPVYHGTFNKFTDFDPKISSPKGFFFASNKEVAASYVSKELADIRVLQAKQNELGKKIGELGSPNSIFETEMKWARGEFKNDPLKDKQLEELIKKQQEVEDRITTIEELGANLYEEPFMSEKGIIKEVYLDTKNPLVVEGNKKHIISLEYEKIIQQAKDKGHDGVIFKNVIDQASSTGTDLTDVHVVFKPEQIKLFKDITFDDAISQIENRGLPKPVNPADEKLKESVPDIRYNIKGLDSKTKKFVKPLLMAVKKLVKDEIIAGRLKPEDVKKYITSTLAERVKNSGLKPDTRGKALLALRNMANDLVFDPATEELVTLTESKLAEAIRREAERNMVRQQIGARILGGIQGIPDTERGKVLTQIDNAISAYADKYNKNNWDSFRGGVYSKLNTLSRQYGVAGSRLVSHALNGDNNYTHFVEQGWSFIDKVETTLNKVNDKITQLEIGKEVTKALEDRDNAQQYLTTPESREVFKNMQEFFDFFKERLTERGYKVLEDYFPHIRQITTAALNRFITTDSPRLKERSQEVAKYDIIKDPMNAMQRYLTSVSRELAYKPLEEYYYGEFVKDIPPLLRGRESYAREFMEGVLTPTYGTGKLFKMARGGATNFYRSALGYNIKASLINTTQKMFADMYITPEAKSMAREAYSKYKTLRGSLKDAAESAKRDTPKWMNQMRQEYGRTPTTGMGKVRDIFDAHDTFQLTETGNWRYAELAGIIDAVTRSPRWEEMVTQGGMNKWVAIEELLKDPTVRESASRNAAILSAETQVAATPAMRGRFYDHPLTKVALMFTQFKFRQLQILAETLGHYEGMNGTRAKNIIRRALDNEVAPVEILREVETTRRSIESALKESKNPALNEVRRELGAYVDYLKTQEHELNAILKFYEPRTWGSASVHWTKYMAKVASYSIATNLLWDAVYDGIAGPTDDKNRTGIIGRVVQDLLIFPWSGYNPHGFMSSPLLPDIKNSNYNFSARTVFKELLSYGLMVATPFGMVERATRRGISKTVTEGVFGAAKPENPYKIGRGAQKSTGTGATGVAK